MTNQEEYFLLNPLKDFETSKRPGTSPTWAKLSPWRR